MLKLVDILIITLKLYEYTFLWTVLKVYYHSDHLKHHPKKEFEGSNLRKYPEQPDRVTNIIDALRNSGQEHVLNTPKSQDFKIVQKVHDQSYLEFLQETAIYLYENNIEEICPTIFSPFLPTHFEPSFHAKLGHYIFDPATPITPGTYQAALSAVDSCISAVESLDKISKSIALSRPPGHHASSKNGGGYCLLNNVAIAAQYLVDKGKSVSILDLDFHHGNGTQEIFYNTDTVQYVSIHADTSVSYPFYWGSKDENGFGNGKGFNHNLPVPPLCSESQYSETLRNATQIISEYSPDIVLVSMGFDCHKDDPIAGMNLSTEFYSSIGEKLKGFDKLAIILEGGYALNAIGPSFMNLYDNLKD